MMAALRREVFVIAVPYDSGRRDFRLGRGPARLIELGLLDALRNAACDVEVQEIVLPTDGFTPETRTAVDLQAAIAVRVAAARRRGAFPLVLAGNCGTSVGTVAGLTAATGSRPVVFWFDAHGDLNTPETTTTGFLDGMALAMLTGRCWRAILERVPGFSPVTDSDVTLIAARDIDPPEQALIDNSAIRHVAATKERDAFDVRSLDEPLRAARGREAYVHVDLDALDPSEGRANGYAAPDGMSRRDLLGALSAIGNGVTLGAAAITAYDPETDNAGSIARIAIDAAVQLVTARSSATSGRLTEQIGGADA
jgi:arginase